MTLVRFKKRHGPYNSGEVAGFTDDVAASMVERGIAELSLSNKVVLIEPPEVNPSAIEPEKVDAEPESVVEPVEEAVIEPPKKEKKRRGFFKGSNKETSETAEE